MSEKPYNPQEIELKWQEAWARDPGLYRASGDPSRPKYYVTEMLPYPSGKLHMGHVRNYSIGDALARYVWMRGFDVLHPMGWDAFGLPAENAAIKNNMPPREWTVQNIANMKRQMQRLGFSYDWSREIATCEPEYYRWNQWFFLRMYERGLAFRKEALVNWCPDCATVLANEQVVNGCCWRHETTPVEQRALSQWFLRITDYAQQLLDDLDKLEGAWPDRVIAMQRNWIGRSEGAEVDFLLSGSDARIRVFTTRIDTIYGATCVILAPEHPMAASLLDEKLQNEAKRMLDARAAKGPGDIEKEGFFTGSYAVNPFNGEQVPVWIGNFVLMGYGTGAIMAVPGHDERDFEFCKQYGIPIRSVIRPEAGEDSPLPYLDDGVLVDSGPYSGMPSAEARQAMSARAAAEGFGNAAITYRLKDWGISRQRYWGTPIPIVYCHTCGVVPVPENQLPVVLPLNIPITGCGRSPLADDPDFMNVPCPRCGSAASRESDTMDTFVDSSWYFYRYCDPHNSEAPFDSAIVERWFPMDQYIGGITHAILHLMYSRFWTKVMRDMGLIKNEEPARNMFTQGMVLKNGTAMSKSKGNVVDPDEIVERYGSDTCRLYTLFAAPPDKDMEWNESAVEGQHRFLSKVYRFITRNIEKIDSPGACPPQAVRKLHQTVGRLTGDFDSRWHFNTSISALHELLNVLLEFEDGLAGEELAGMLRTFILLLAPFAPYLAQELWAEIGQNEPILRQQWPAFDPELAREPEADIPIQINGKVRGRISLAFGTPAADVEKKALSDPKIQGTIGAKQIVKVIVVPDKLVNIVIK